ncbi:Cytochrome c oxidase assembly protein COX11, mitochondrial [Tetrabaena socialis]|uniref:Cytochrome c oxidase assembly protein COX11, mitochondrial n=1 Tax=Tetrabaena socialis TaxID=47790 RepID=A0A2J7ZZ45_9CHLO|nr:Cytochrome c oxidase assembly protein COX11, mitochondrial [Tetrabaena socialis]|eukprot:PNH05518.1 Cytochrome c oxidase assembly protein COX11, mitochondrial [Tetrabaena socialis]
MLRRASLLVARGLQGATQSAESGSLSRLCGGASTSGRPSSDAWWAGAAAFRTTRGVHQTRARPHSTAAEQGLYWGSAAVFMIGLSYAMVPLYKLFCAATGYGGTVRAGKSVEEKLKRRLESPDAKVEEAAAAREIRIWFNADVSETMPWTFTPTQEYVRVRPGQSTLVFFTAHNKSDKPVTGYSLYNVTPDKAAFYFNKIQCFCFEEQRLRAGEVIDMPVFFYIDPEFATDWNCRNVDDITLSYMFHKVEEDDEEEEDESRFGLKLHSGSHPMGPDGAKPPMAAGLQAVPHTGTAAPPTAVAQ